MTTGDASLLDDPVAQMPDGAPMVRPALRPDHVAVVHLQTRFPSGLEG